MITYVSTISTSETREDDYYDTIRTALDGKPCFFFLILFFLLPIVLFFFPFSVLMKTTYDYRWIRVPKRSDTVWANSARRLSPI